MDMTTRTRRDIMSTLNLNVDHLPATMSGRPVIALGRRNVDRVLIALGLVAAVVFATAGGLLMWGSSFANDYVRRELTAQHVFFPDAAALTAEGRTDLLGHAGDQVTSGNDAEAYA